jgi:perosamine synthetase
LIRVCEPLLTEEDRARVAECLHNGWISSSGPFIGELEEKWAAYCGRRHGVAVSNGTTALTLALGCLDLQPGDEVILPTFTIISCVVAVLHYGAVPVLVDSTPDTWCMDVTKVEEKISPRTRAIIPVHIYGHPVQMDAILELAERRGLAVVEDAAEAHGAMFLSARGGWRRCGSFGTLSCFSFYANKPVTTGEGGMVLTDDPGLADRLRSLRNLGFSSQHRFRHEQLGVNARLTALQAALGVSQIQRIDEIVERKRWIAREYTTRLGGVPGLELQGEQAWARSIYWMNGVVISEEHSLDARGLAATLAEREIETRPFFLGMHQQPALLERRLFAGERYPVAERLASRGLYLPSGLGLSETELSQVCDAVRSALS